MDGPAAPKRKTSGLTIVLALLGGFALVAVIGVVLAGVLVWRNPEGRKFLGTMGDAYRIMTKAQKAPGTKEIRALGCQQAVVLEVDDFMKIAGRYDAGATMPPSFGGFVMCAAKPWGTPPTCDDVAKAYIQGAGPRERGFIASVTQSGRSKAVCQVEYDAQGRRVRDFEEDVDLPDAPAE